MKFKFVSLLFLTALVTACISKHENSNKVKIVGAMKEVMQKGQLQGNINLDTITNKTNLYGLGPLEYLKGELMVFNGISYKAVVTSPTTMQLQETFDVKAPFFGYANISDWEKIKLPDSITTMNKLERYVDAITKEANRPFMFRLNGRVTDATIHVVNLPEGTKISSSKDAHKGLIRYNLKNEEVDILGFFSTEHKTILTHHDTYMHLHLITADRKQMGHLEKADFKSDAISLYLPK